MSLPNVEVPDLFKSKRFWAAVVGAVLSIAVTQFPDLEPHVAALQETFLILFGGALITYGAQDAAQAWKTGTTKYDKIQLHG